mmetsp:Transcript_6184/g.21082  ORF Transcript_6184/g.21082 Transcript_6184/m.21082 type:complete len:230 (+) Transcript_6184:327-1016(+)
MTRSGRQHVAPQQLLCSPQQHELNRSVKPGSVSEVTRAKKVHRQQHVHHFSSNDDVPAAGSKASTTSPTTRPPSSTSDRRKRRLSGRVRTRTRPTHAPRTPKTSSATPPSGTATKKGSAYVTTRPRNRPTPAHKPIVALMPMRNGRARRKRSIPAPSSEPSTDSKKCMVKARKLRQPQQASAARQPHFDSSCATSAAGSASRSLFVGRQRAVYVGDVATARPSGSAETL